MGEVILAKKKRNWETVVMDFSEQLAAMRQKIAAIDVNMRTRDETHRVAAPAHTAQLHFADDLISGSVIETPAGKHFETVKLWERHRRHGSVGIADLEHLPEDLLDSLSGGAIAKVHPTKWCFLDTDTTGLAGGTGTYAFLIGCGSIEPDGFRVRQFFMRDYGEEASQLHALSEYLERFDVMITYNGKAYDQPLLETRYRMVRARPPFARMEHLDLLFGARRLWKIRLDCCRLSYLEHQILGVEREGDLPGELIPYYYFDYVRTQRAVKLVPILPSQCGGYRFAGVFDGVCAGGVPVAGDGPGAAWGGSVGCGAMAVAGGAWRKKRWR